MNKKKYFKLYNFLWYMIGSLSFGFTSLIYVVIITRLLSIEEAGKFSFAFAIACTFYVIGVYFGRTFQVSDTSEKYSDTDYIYNKITTCIIMIIVTLIFCVIRQLSMEKILLIIILTLYRGIDAFLDAVHGVIQKKDNIYKIGKLNFYRTISLILIFFLTIVLSKNLLISCLSLLIINFLFIFIFDIRIAKPNIIKTKFNHSKNYLLLKEGIFVFIFSFLAIVILNCPKYVIETYMNDQIQGIFGILFMPSSFLSLVSLYIIQPYINEMAEAIKNNNRKILNRLVLKISFYIIVCGIFVIILGYYIGIPILNILYDINLNEYKILFVIILIASILYSLYSLLSTALVAMRRNFAQDIVLLITCIFTIIICNILIKVYGLSGASYSYFITMLFQLILFIVIYLHYQKRIGKKKKIVIRLMGGLGNQMFQYAILRSISLKWNTDAVIDLKGITNKSHNVYGLNHCSISKDVMVEKKVRSVKGIICYLLYGIDWVIFCKLKNGYKFYEILQPLLNSLGMYCVPRDYINLNPIVCDINYMVGYYQANDYVKDYEKIIKNELQIKDKLKGKNKKMYNDIQKSNSVCIHIRRGDYIGTSFQVCNNDYYYKAINEMNKKVKNATFYIFSDEIEWVKNNMDFSSYNVIFIDWKNTQFEDLKLMSTCKHFIMSNSSFSYWAQYLSSNNKKVVMAPNKWNEKSNGKESIYNKKWIIIETN